MIIARTDARAVAGLDEAMARANAALDAGADMAFVEAPQTMEELAAVPKRVAGPCLLNVVRGGKTPEIDLARAQAMGYRLAIVPGLLLKAVIGACDEVLAELKATQRPSGAAQRHDGARRIQPRRRDGMGCAAHAVPAIRTTGVRPNDRRGDTAS